MFCCEIQWDTHGGSSFLSLQWTQEKENWERSCPGALELVAWDYHWKLNFYCLSFLMLHVAFHQHINCPHHWIFHRTLILSQNDWWCLFDITSFKSIIYFTFFLFIIIFLSFLQKSLPFLLIVCDTIVKLDCILALNILSIFCSLLS